MCAALCVNTTAHCKLSMIAVIPFLIILALSAASPLTTRQSSYQCHNRTVTIPKYCSDALNEYYHLLQKLYNLTRPSFPTQDLPQALSETTDMLQPVFSVFCTDECLQLLVGCSHNDTETEAIKKVILFTTCAQAEDGTFCQVKLYQANYEDILLRSGYIHRLQNCSTSTTCSSTCQQSFRDLKTSFGCCATNYFETPSGPYNSYYKRYLANCSVPVGTTCNSASEPDGTGGAAIVYLNVVLVIAGFLITITIA